MDSNQTETMVTEEPGTSLWCLEGHDEYVSEPDDLFELFEIDPGEYVVEEWSTVDNNRLVPSMDSMFEWALDQARDSVVEEWETAAVTALGGAVDKAFTEARKMWVDRIAMLMCDRRIATHRAVWDGDQVTWPEATGE